MEVIIGSLTEVDMEVEVVVTVVMTKGMTEEGVTNPTMTVTAGLEVMDQSVGTKEGQGLALMTAHLLAKSSAPCQRFGG